MQKIAILDIDNTLYEGTLGIDLLKRLMQDRLFDEEAGKKIVEVFTAYRNNEIPRADIFDIIYPIYGKGITGLQTTTLQTKAREVYQQKKGGLFAFTRAFLSYLQSQHYSTLALSGSSDEIVSCLCLDIGIDNFFGAKIESYQGVYTGKLIQVCSSASRKKRIVQEYIHTSGIIVDRERSLAVGDSETESLLFDMVGIPLVFEPHASFRPTAQSNPNRILVDRSTILQTVKSLI